MPARTRDQMRRLSYMPDRSIDRERERDPYEDGRQFLCIFCDDEPVDEEYDLCERCQDMQIGNQSEDDGRG